MFFNKSLASQMGLMGVNFVAASYSCYKMFQEPDQLVKHGVDMSVHLLTFYLAQNRIPRPVQNGVSAINTCHAAARLALLTTSKDIPTFVWGMADVLLHLTNASLIINDEATRMMPKA